MAPTPDVFEEEVRLRFQYLLKEYEFGEPTVESGGYWRAVSYASRAVRIQAQYELGALPWVVIHRISWRGSEPIIRESLNVEILLGFSQRSLGNPWGAPDVPEDVLRARVADLSDALRRQGEQYLRGHFDARWDELVVRQKLEHEKRIDAALAKENKPEQGK
jgi:hypothetical protein